MLDYVSWSMRYYGFPLNLRHLWLSFTTGSERYAHSVIPSAHEKVGHFVTVAMPSHRRKGIHSVLLLGSMRTQWNVESLTVWGRCISHKRDKVCKASKRAYKNMIAGFAQAKTELKTYSLRWGFCTSVLFNFSGACLSSSNYCLW